MVINDNVVTCSWWTVSCLFIRGGGRYYTVINDNVVTCSWWTVSCLSCSSDVGSCQCPSINTGCMGFMVALY